MDTPDILRRTPLYALHKELGGKMVPFAGYEMPVQYPAGILKEHLHTRAAGRDCLMSRIWARHFLPATPPNLNGSRPPTSRA
jgi:hypothetical protein